MASEWLRVTLRGHAPNLVLGADFFSLFGAGVSRFAVRPGEEEGEAALIFLVDEELATYAKAAEPSEAFDAAIRDSLQRAGEWLLSCPASAFASCRDRGISLDISVTSWIDDNQFDLRLPDNFVRACARAELGISVMTNP
jgi:hypothetical protein